MTKIKEGLGLFGSLVVEGAKKTKAELAQEREIIRERGINSKIINALKAFEQIYRGAGEFGSSTVMKLLNVGIASLFNDLNKIDGLSGITAIELNDGSILTKDQGIIAKEQMGVSDDSILTLERIVEARENQLKL